MSHLKNAIKWLFLKDQSIKPVTKIRAVSNEEFLGRLKRKMPLEYIAFDEYVPSPEGHLYYRDSLPAKEKNSNESLKRKKDKQETPQCSIVSLLREALEDAKAIRETAKINVKISMDEAFNKNRKHMINNTTEPIILPVKKDKISGLEMDDFDLNKIFAQRRVKVYDKETW